MEMNPMQIFFVLFIVVMLMVSKVAEANKGKKSNQKKPVKRTSAVSRTSPPSKAKKTPDKGNNPVHRSKIWIGEENDHDHIPSTALSRDKKLEQLKTLREAGLLTNEEYAQALKKVMARKT